MLGFGTAFSLVRKWRCSVHADSMCKDGIIVALALGLCPRELRQCFSVLFSRLVLAFICFGDVEGTQGHLLLIAQRIIWAPFHRAGAVYVLRLEGINKKRRQHAANMQDFAGYAPGTSQRMFAMWGRVVAMREPQMWGKSFARTGFKRQDFCWFPRV